MIPRELQIKELIMTYTPQELAVKVLDLDGILSVADNEISLLKAELNTYKRLYQEVKDILIRFTDK